MSRANSTCKKTHFVFAAVSDECRVGANCYPRQPVQQDERGRQDCRGSLKSHLHNLGIDRDLKSYDFTIQAINLNQAKEGAETSVAFFLSMVSAILNKPLLERTVVLGEMSVQGMLLKVNALPERMQFAVESGAKRILIPSENKRDVADVPDAILTAIQWQFYDSPIRAAVLALGLA